jgi:hypothetical protein
MELMQTNSTDRRLDDLNHKVDQGFERVDTDIRELRAESRAEFTALRSEMRSESSALRVEVKAGFDAINQHFEALHRLMIQFGGGLFVTVIAALLVSRL